MKGNMGLLAVVGILAAGLFLFKDRISNLSNHYAITEQNKIDNAANAAIPKTYYSDYMGGNVQFSDWGSSWTTESIKTGTVDTELGTLDTLLSGRGWTDDGQSIPGQIAYYNPESGNAWGGTVGTMDYLYNSMDQAAVAWRLKYG